MKNRSPLPPGNIPKTPARYDEVDEIVIMQLEFPGGAIANLHTSFAASTDTLYVTADKG